MKQFTQGVQCHSCLAPGAGARFAGIPIRDHHKGAWHRVRGRDLLAFRFGITKVPGTNGSTNGTARGSQRCQALGDNCARANNKPSHNLEFLTSCWYGLLIICVSNPLASCAQVRSLTRRRSLDRSLARPGSKWLSPRQRQAQTERRRSSTSQPTRSMPLRGSQP